MIAWVVFDQKLIQNHSKPRRTLVESARVAQWAGGTLVKKEFFPSQPDVDTVIWLLSSHSFSLQLILPFLFSTVNLHFQTTF